MRHQLISCQHCLSRRTITTINLAATSMLCFVRSSAILNTSKTTGDNWQAIDWFFRFLLNDNRQIFFLSFIDCLGLFFKVSFLKFLTHVMRRIMVLMSSVIIYRDIVWRDCYYELWKNSEVLYLFTVCLNVSLTVVSFCQMMCPLSGFISMKYVILMNLSTYV